MEPNDRCYGCGKKFDHLSFKQYCSRCYEEVESNWPNKTNFVDPVPNVVEQAKNLTTDRNVTNHGFKTHDISNYKDQLERVVWRGPKTTMSDFDKLRHDIWDHICELTNQKNADYTAGSNDAFANFRVADDFGVDEMSGAALRMNDKFQRVKSFLKQGVLKVPGETIEDALLDIIGYCLILLGLLHEKRPLSFLKPENKD